MAISLLEVGLDDTRHSSINLAKIFLSQIQAAGFIEYHSDIEQWRISNNREKTTAMAHMEGLDVVIVFLWNPCLDRRM